MSSNRRQVIILTNDDQVMWHHMALLGNNGLTVHFVLAMMTSSNGNIFRVIVPLSREFTGHGEFPSQRQVTRGFDVFFDLRLNKRLNKQTRRRCFETPSCSLWRHCNGRQSLGIQNWYLLIYSNITTPMTIGYPWGFLQFPRFQWNVSYNHIHLYRILPKQHDQLCQICNGGV